MILKKIRKELHQVFFKWLHVKSNKIIIREKEYYVIVYHRKYINSNQGFIFETKQIFKYKKRKCEQAYYFVINNIDVSPNGFLETFANYA